MPEPDEAKDTRGRRARALGKSLVMGGVVAFVIGLLTLEAGSRAIHVWIDLGWTAFGVAATVSSLYVMRKTAEPGRKRAWTAFSLGCISWTLGIFQWTWLELVAGVVTPFPALGDIGYLTTPVCFALGLLFYGSDAPGVKTTLKQVGELGIVLATMGLTFCFVFGDALEQEGTSLLYRATALSYPVLHSTALVFALTTLWSRAWQKRSLRVVAYIFAALLSHTVVNTYYAQTLLLARYEAGHLMDPGWCLAFAFVMLAALEERARESASAGADERARVTMGDILTPSICLAVITLSGTMEGFQATSTAPFLGLMGLLLAVSLGVRNLAQRRIEQALRDEVQERERQFVEAQKMKAVATLAGGLAHDFNNLLTGVLGGVSMLRHNTALGQGDASYLDLVEQSAERAADLTRRLLVFAHRRETRIEATRPWDVLDRASSLVRSAAPANITVRVEGERRDLVVHADASQLEHALVNLGLNAVHAMPHGGTLRFVLGVARVDASDALVFEVHDTGVGIPSDVREHIFEPFYSTRAPGQGTGLGLAMVKSAATAHGGTVDVVSRVGEGTSFTLHIPLDVADALELPADEPVRVSSGHETVLVVDDRGAALHATQAVLESSGYRVLPCTRGSEALERAQQEPLVDLLVVDLGLPDMDGLELAARLRVLIPSLPVLVITGSVVPDELPRFVVGVVAKPYRSKDLTAAVRAALDARQTEVREVAG